eukprot:GILJ01001489.1.p1 GENE.GILJ01001489.1~~GILJ01001489.1.p1  ORF type:complete len:339 (-),score=25.82 GILJ01001489.1:558-1574(-)
MSDVAFDSAFEQNTDFSGFGCQDNAHSFLDIRSNPPLNDNFEWNESDFLPSLFVETCSDNLFESFTEMSSMGSPDSYTTESSQSGNTSPATVEVKIDPEALINIHYCAATHVVGVKRQYDSSVPTSSCDSSSESSESKPDEREVKRQRRLMKNRESACKSRQRKKQYIDELEGTIEQYSTECSQVSTRISSLDAENKVLREEVSFLQNLIKRTPRLSAMADSLLIQPVQNNKSGFVMFAVVLSLALAFTPMPSRTIKDKPYGRMLLSQQEEAFIPAEPRWSMAGLVYGVQEHACLVMLFGLVLVGYLVCRQRWRAATKARPMGRTPSTLWSHLSRCVV